MVRNTMNEKVKVQKWLVCLFLMIAVCFAVVPALTVKAETSGDWEYTVKGDGTVEITEYTGSGGDVEIPSTIA